MIGSRNRPQQVVAIIGRPIAQVSSPAIWNRIFSGQGIDAVMVPFEIGRGGLAPFFAWMRHAENLAGSVVTIPYKADVPGLCDIVRPEAAFLGAANAVRRDRDGRLECAMFDGLAMAAAIEDKGIRIAGARVLLVGAGSTGSAIAEALCREQVGELMVFDRDHGRAAALRRKLAECFSTAITVIDQPANAGHPGIVINASPAGSKADDALPFPSDAMATSMLVCDVVTDPSPTPLIAAAQSQGCRVVTGHDMAAAQAPLLMAYFGIAPADDTLR